MSAEGEGVENQGANDGNSEEKQSKEESTQGEIADDRDPTQPVHQNGGDIVQDSSQVTVGEKEGVAEKDKEKKENNEVFDASIDPKNSITTEEISENPPEEQRSPAGQKEDPAMSVVISEPDKDVVTQEANAQTEGRGSPIWNAGDSADSPGKGDNRVIESQSESDSPLVAPPTSKAEKSIDNEVPVPESGGIAKDGFTANGKLNGTIGSGLQYPNNCS